MDSGPNLGRDLRGKANVEDDRYPSARSQAHIPGIRRSRRDAQTIRPERQTALRQQERAGAWRDPRTPEAETAEFLRLGGGKSLVDQSGENHAVLGFMTHLNQVGQAGSTPRHSKRIVNLLPRGRAARGALDEQRLSISIPTVGGPAQAQYPLCLQRLSTVMTRLNALLAKK